MPRNDRADAYDGFPDRSGYCYIFTHVHMLNPLTGSSILKIGATRKHPIRRATELGISTGVPGDFTVAYYCAVPDAFIVEKAAHKAFVNDRIDEGREFFSCSLEDAISFIRHYVHETFGIVPKEGGDWIENGGSIALEMRDVAHMNLPMSELFATFPDDGKPRKLTSLERAACEPLMWRNK